MDCIKDSVLTEYISGKLDAGTREQVQKHLTECSKCSERFRDVSRLWETLGRWDVDTTAHSITDRVVASAEKSVFVPKKSKGSIITSKVFWSDVLRIAASIIIAIVIGQSLGKLSTGRKMHDVIQHQVEPKYVAALSLDWSIDFTKLIVEDDNSGLENDNE